MPAACGAIIVRSATIVSAHILLIDCPDETGLVHRVTGVLYRHGCNIVSNGEFVDREAMTAFAAANKALRMQHAIDAVGARRSVATARERGGKGARVRAAALETRTMPGGERGRLIEEE